MQSIKSKLKSSKPHDQAIDGLKYAWPALRLALTVFEKTLDGVPIPGLKGSIGGFLELAKVAEVCAERLIPQSCSISDSSTGVNPELGGCAPAPEADYDTHFHFYSVVWGTRSPSRSQNSYRILLRVGAFLVAYIRAYHLCNF
jgi:hypothetical protein